MAGHVDHVLKKGIHVFSKRGSTTLGRMPRRLGAKNFGIASKEHKLFLHFKQLLVRNLLKGVVSLSLHFVLIPNGNLVFHQLAHEHQLL
jgi:hypothetical protein